MNIRDEIGKRLLFFDGGMGSLLQKRGLQAGELPETWNILKPDVLTEIHKEYAEAGADIILANTFGANRFKYADNLEEIVNAAVVNAREGIRLEYLLINLGCHETIKLVMPCVGVRILL